ncbi:MAG: hypothetical protein NZM13_06615 [Cyclobacteriaceae bacterium]|nr:hypothetical protein [Cyclobacteriaceae bacterium]MDW8331800.1 hypothetical protein [Cyclobacteriaceae bacterium]
MARKGIILMIGLLAACNLRDEMYYSVFSLSFNFTESDMGWTGDFADYPKDDSVFYELIFKHDTLPANLNANGNRKALMLSGRNYSDDLFMFIKRKITGLKPNTRYDILFNVQLASNAPTGAVGIGGAPGESVFLKAGITTTEPRKVPDADDYYRMNIDKGNQAAGGEDMMVLGHIGVAPNTTRYTQIFRNNSSLNPFSLQTDSTGEAWIIVGTDSGFEGKTTLFYISVDILFNERVN